MGRKIIDPTIHVVFPCPVYITKRDTNISSNEEKEIGEIIQEGMQSNVSNSMSNNSDIFNSKLKELKQFCEEQLNRYVKEIMNPKEELDFHITQSWLNVTKRGEFHHEHSHPNSIVSGVFYISTEADDKITFIDPNMKVKEMIKIEQESFNPFNSSSCFFPSIANELFLFPSWLNHMVRLNEKATKDRISISFNTFVKGSLGSQTNLTELLLR